MPAQLSERRCPQAWRSAGSGRTDRARPSPVSSGHSSSPGPASSPSGWNSALKKGQGSLLLMISYNAFQTIIHFS